MAKSTESFTPVTGDLFQGLEQPSLDPDNAPDLGLEPELMGAVNTALRLAKRSGFSRERIVQRMNQSLVDSGDKVTLRQLNSWTAKSKENHSFPAKYLPAFCWATQCTAPLAALLGSLGFELADSRDQLALQMGQNIVTMAALSRQQRKLKTDMGL